MRNCLHCKIELVAKNTKYCSVRCQQNFQSAVRLENWLKTGEPVGMRVMRNYITNRDGFKCSVCEISEWQNKPIVLEMEHIDGNSENNTPENLCLICPNCHSQTPTYKAKNKGNGRHKRRQRYAEGKSF